jgi:hypothetical protein
VTGVIGALMRLRNCTLKQLDFLKKPAQFHWLWFLLAPLFGVSLLCALIPPGILWGDEPNGYDVVEYHLQVPREWFEAGRIIPLHHNVFSYFPFNVEMHYLLAMHLLGGPWAGMYLSQLMHVCFIGLTVLAVYALLAEQHPRGAIVAAVLAGATPWMSLLAPIAYNEGGLLLFSTLAIGLAMRSLRETQPLKWMLLAGAMAGFACGSKLTGVTMILLPVPIIFAGGLFVRKNKHRTSNIEHRTSNEVQPSMLNVECSMFSLLFAFGFSALVTFSPWLIRNTIWAGNPVFPEATSIFGKAHWSDVQVERWKRANHQPPIKQQNLQARLQAGWDQVLGDSRFAYALIPLGVIAIALRRDRESVCLGLLLLFQAIFWLFFTHLQSRFFVLAIPISALLIGGVAGRIWNVSGIVFAVLFIIGAIVFTEQKIGLIAGKFEAIGLNLFMFEAREDISIFSHQPQDVASKKLELVGDAQTFWYDVPMKQLYYRTVFDVDSKPGENDEQMWMQGWPTGADVIVIRDDQALERFHQTYWMIPPENQPISAPTGK